MRLVHMPCGVHSFADYGYQRYPYRPVCGDAVLVQVMAEEAQSGASACLAWEKDGQAMPNIPGRPFHRPGDDRLFFQFDMGPFSGPCSVSYTVSCQDENGLVQTKPYAFAVTRPVSLGLPKRVLVQGKCAYAIFKHAVVHLDGRKGAILSVWDASAPVRGEAISFGERALTPSLALRWEKDCFSWELKRYNKMAASWDAAQVQLYLDKDEKVHAIRWGPHLAGERIVGLGERFDQVEQQGQKRLLRVVEHYAHQGPNTYLPIPFFMTNGQAGWFSPCMRRLEADFTEGIRFFAETPQKGLLLQEHYLTGTYRQMLRRLHALTGAAALPPKWALGVWISSNGWNSQKETMEQLQALRRLSLPATAMVLEAWSDEKTFYIFNDAEYTPNDGEGAFALEDFTFPAQGKWPDPAGMAKSMGEQDIRLVLWQIPVIKHAWEGPNAQLLADEAYAIREGLCVKNDDGTPYRITDNWFRNSLLLDFSNPRAVQWWFSKRQYLVEALGVAGFKTDGGEFLFDDTARLHDGQTGETAHNDYPMQYIRAYHAFLQAHGGGVTFSRAGYLGAQTLPIHWAGDQESTWAEFRAQLTAGLTAGLSGIPFWSFDIGGFAGEFPTRELYLRSVAMGAFSPVMQWHSEPRNGQFYYTQRERWNNDRSPWNLAALYQDGSIVAVYRLFANLRMNLLPYLYQEARHCAKTARPLMAHLMLDYEKDEKACRVHDAYLLGREVLVAPITQEGAAGRNIYLPKGRWHDLFLGTQVEGGRDIWYPCPVERLPVFVRDGAALAVNMNEAGIIGSTEAGGFVQGGAAGYAKLAFLCYGNAACTFEDGEGIRLRVEKGTVRGTGIGRVTLIQGDVPGADVLVCGQGRKACEAEVALA